MEKFPIIFWVHSPIGYESYFAFKKSNPDSDVRVCTARNICVGNSIFDLGMPGLYQSENMEEIDRSSLKIMLAIEKIISEHGGYVLVIPQIAQPYIKILARSKYCRGFAYYDEGSACYGESFNVKTRAFMHQYELRIPKNMLRLANFMGVDINKLKMDHRIGVQFFDFKSSKYLGCFSFFQNAFPDMGPIIMPRPDYLEYAKVCGDYGLVLIGGRVTQLGGGELNFSDNVHASSIRNIVKIMGAESTIIKPHPNHDDAVVQDFARDLGVRTWKDFCAEKSINASHEPSFMNFRYYVGEDNSTMLYLANMGRSNFIIIK